MSASGQVGHTIFFQIMCQSIKVVVSGIYNSAMKGFFPDFIRHFAAGIQTVP